jgi:hypothetical protein
MGAPPTGLVQPVALKAGHGAYAIRTCYLTSFLAHNLGERFDDGNNEPIW